MMQPRFEKRTGSSPYSLLDQPRFRAGFDFLRLRAQTGEIDPALGEWWEKFSTAYDDERHEMIEQVRQAQMQRPQKPRTRVKRADAGVPKPLTAALAADTLGAAGEMTDGNAVIDPALEHGAQGVQGDMAAPAKKRRRRRKPVNRDTAEAGNDSATDRDPRDPHHPDDADDGGPSSSNAGLATGGSDPRDNPASRRAAPRRNSSVNTPRV